MARAAEFDENQRIKAEKAEQSLADKIASIKKRSEIAEAQRETDETVPRVRMNAERLDAERDLADKIGSIKKRSELEDAQRETDETARRVKAAQSLATRIASIKKRNEVAEAKRSGGSETAKRVKEEKSRKEREQREDEAEKRRQYTFRVSQGVKAKRQEEAEVRRTEAEAKTEGLANKQRNAQRATAAITGAQGKGGSFQKALGTIGAIAGSVEAGPEAAVIGQALGEKAGKQLDDPFNQLTSVLNATTKAFSATGDVLERVAGNDGLGAITTATSATADALEEIPYAGKFVAAEFRTLTAGLSAANKVVTAFSDRAKELSRYNGPIAGAVAMQDVTALLSDIREAQRMSAGYTKLIEKQTEMNESLKAGLMPIKEVVVNYLPGAIDIFLKQILNILKALEVFGRMVGEDDNIFKRMHDEIVGMRRDLRGAGGGAGADALLEAWLGRGAAPAGAFPAIPRERGIGDRVDMGGPPAAAVRR